MKKSDVHNAAERKRLDKINNERQLNTNKRVAEVIRLLGNVIDINTISTDDIDIFIDKISKAINILDSAEEEMSWHCEWFEYDSSVCLEINEACVKLGSALALLLEDNKDNFDDIRILCDIKDALEKLAKALATLVRWNITDEMC